MACRSVLRIRGLFEAEKKRALASARAFEAQNPNVPAILGIDDELTQALAMAAQSLVVR